MQLSEPEVKMSTPSSQVKMLAARFDLMTPLFSTIISTKPSMPPDFSMR